MKRANRKYSIAPPTIFQPIKENTIFLIEDYCQIFIDHFDQRFSEKDKYFLSDVYVNKDFIAVNFKISDESRNTQIKYYFNSNLDEVINSLGSLGFQNVSTNLFTQQNIRGFNRDSFYVIKPNIFKNWHRALAHLDLSEFIEAITKSELKVNKI